MVSLKRAVLAGQGCVNGETDKWQSHVSAHPVNVIMHFQCPIPELENSWSMHGLTDLCEIPVWMSAVFYSYDQTFIWLPIKLTMVCASSVGSGGNIQGELWRQVGGWAGNRGCAARKHTLQGSQTRAESLPQPSVRDHSHSFKLRTSQRARTEHVGSCQESSHAWHLT